MGMEVQVFSLPVWNYFKVKLYARTDSSLAPGGLAFMKSCEMQLQGLFVKLFNVNCGFRIFGGISCLCHFLFWQRPAEHLVISGV